MQQDTTFNHFVTKSTVIDIELRSQHSAGLFPPVTVDTVLQKHIFTTSFFHLGKKIGNGKVVLKF